MKTRLFTVTLTMFILIGYLLSWEYPLSKSSPFENYFLYVFTHASLIHLIPNLLVIFFVGSWIEKTSGKGIWFALTLLTAIVGGLAFVLTNTGQVVGSSGVAIGMIAYWAILEPNDQVKLYWVFPVRRIFILLGLVGYDLFMYTYRYDNAVGTAHVTHLTSAFATFLFVIFLREYYLFVAKKKWKAYKNKNPYIL